MCFGRGVSSSEDESEDDSEDDSEDEISIGLTFFLLVFLPSSSYIIDNSLLAPCEWIMKILDAMHCGCIKENLGMCRK